EIATAPYPHELRQPLNLATDRLGLQGEMILHATERLSRTNQGIRILIKPVEGRIAGPSVLHEFELAADIRVKTNEMQPPGLIVVALIQMPQHVLRQHAGVKRLAVGSATTQQT